MSIKKLADGRYRIGVHVHNGEDGRVQRLFGTERQAKEAESEIRHKMRPSSVPRDATRLAQGHGAAEIQSLRRVPDAIKLALQKCSGRSPARLARPRRGVSTGPRVMPLIVAAPCA